jgi:hypothetical protein
MMQGWCRKMVWPPLLELVAANDVADTSLRDYILCLNVALSPCRHSVLKEDAANYNARASRIWTNAEQFDWRAETVFKYIQVGVFLALPPRLGSASTPMQHHAIAIACLQS